LYEKQQKQETIMKTFLLFIGLMLVISRPAIAGPLFDSLSDEKRSLIRSLIQDQFPDSTLSVIERDFLSGHCGPKMAEEELVKGLATK
jgi:hypothetical protein